MNIEDFLGGVLCVDYGKFLHNHKSDGGHVKFGRHFN